MPAARALFHLANTAMAQQHWDSAEAHLREALALQPDWAELHANLAWLLDLQGDKDSALEHYSQAVELQPDNPRIHINLGAHLAERKSHALAFAAYQTALALDPQSPGAWSNLGALQSLLGDTATAEASLRHAIALDDTHFRAHFNLACLLLRQARFAEGWPHWERRAWDTPQAHTLTCPRWHGQPLTGSKVLVVFEAGYGDTLQFSRYLGALRTHGATQVDLLCQSALQDVLVSLTGVDQVLTPDTLGAHAHDWDWWVPVMSLPVWLSGAGGTPQGQTPYLSAPPAKIRTWHTAIAAHCPPGALRVGLVWQGSPQFMNDSERSLASLQLLAPLWRTPGAVFVSLQKNAVASPAEASALPLLDMTEQLHDFGDTAALIATLDLVISVDTAVAHLAGAMGKPCWVLLPAYMTDWRWLEQRDDSPWYPGMRLFRQTAEGGWPEVVERVQLALQQLAD